MSEPVIEAANVTKSFGSGPARVQALKGVSLTLNGGELTVLMGPSGSGKTTLLSILGCMLAPTGGTVRVCGTSTSGARPEELANIRRQHIGFVFQSYHLFSTLTAAENVRLALDLRGERGPKAIAKSEEALASVGLRSKMASFPRQLSGGEQQRVAIARAIVAEPSAILADEPTAALDAPNGKATMAILSAIAKNEAAPFLWSLTIRGCLDLPTGSSTSRTARSPASGITIRDRATGCRVTSTLLPLPRPAMFLGTRTIGSHGADGHGDDGVLPHRPGHDISKRVRPKQPAPARGRAHEPHHKPRRHSRPN